MPMLNRTGRHLPASCQPPTRGMVVIGDRLAMDNSRRHIKPGKTAHAKFNCLAVHRNGSPHAATADTRVIAGTTA